VHGLVPVAERAVGPSSAYVGLMRAVAESVVARGEGGPLPRFEELAEVSRELRRHLHVLLPTVERLAARARTAECRREALETVALAREVLAVGPGQGLVSALRHARSLARELRALCERHASLTAAPTTVPVARETAP
jgi:hypothetical protein